MKSAYERSLRCQVEKWLAPGSGTVQVTWFGRTRIDHRRFVRVEILQGDSSKALFFFHHDDGRWCPYPPTRRQRYILNELLAA
jgi:hypothetical protein